MFEPEYEADIKEVLLFDKIRMTVKFTIMHGKNTDQK